MTSATPERSRADHAPATRTEKTVTTMVVAACAAFVFWQLQPELIFTNSTPTGGDMGAHVWGPAFLRDELLPQLRLTGWTPDWYTGFPAFHFYMVIPSLGIVILDVGLNPFISVPLVLALGGAAVFTYMQGNLARSRQLAIACALLAPLLIAIPYNVAFKLVAVSGVVMFPVAAWALGHFGGLRYPGPAVLSVSSLAFAFDRSFNIYGGNIASTLAGEFAASISLSLSLVALGLVIRGTRTGEYRGWAAVAIALTALSHLLPAFFLLAAVILTMIVRVVQRRFSSVGWMMTAGMLAVFLSAFWVLPFYMRTAFLNDMGWERIEILHSPLVTRSDLNPANILSDFPPLPVLLVLAAIGLFLSIVRKVELGWILALTGALMAAGFVWFPDGRLWNARILPFYYLCVALLAGLAVYLLIVEIVRTPAVLRAGFFLSSLILLWPSDIHDAVDWPEPAGSFADPINSFGRLVEVMGDYLPPAAAYSTRVVCIALLTIIIGTELPRLLGYVFNRIEVVAFITALAVILVSPARDVSLESIQTAAGGAWAVVLVIALTVVLLALISGVRTLNDRLQSNAAARAQDAVAVEDSPDVMPAVRTQAPVSTLDAITQGRRGAASQAALAGAPVFAAAAMFVLLGLSLQTIGGIRTVDAIPTWSLGPLKIASADQSFIPGWSSWNFSGLQAKPEVENGPGDVGQGGWEEYEFVQRTMIGVGEEIGCGRAMWEFAPELNRYGTTMAMMLMPMWSDSCIGSMEGLYFEATPTVPYHFMLQSDLSAPSRSSGTDQSVGGPSRAMRDLPYGDFDIDRGVERMLDMGVRYYMAFSPQTIEAARNHASLTEVADATPWVVFETEARLVEPLATAPVVIDGVRDHQDEWLDVGMEWFQQPDQARPASSGPAEWRSVPAAEVVERYEAEDTRLAGSITEGSPLLEELLPSVDIAQATAVSNVATDTDRISFTVDQVGTPVLVRTSYFPSWKARGADGPYRVAPNFMVVVPTEENVELVFSRTGVDWVATLMTLAGLVGLAALGRRPRTPTTVELAPDASYGSTTQGTTTPLPAQQGTEPLPSEPDVLV